LTNERSPAEKSGIKNWWLSGYSSILLRSNFGVGGQESSPQSFTAYSLARLPKFEKEQI
jgi:hypothetical protein